MRSVDPEIYTEDYFLRDCADFEEYKRSKGETLGPRLKRVVKYISLKPGMTVLDIGCGRGELAIWAAKKGARVTAIDYSKAAVKLTKAAISRKPKKVKDRIKVKLLNAKDVDKLRGKFDLIVMTDVLEHLYPEEQRIIIGKLNKITKRGGRILAHTEPNHIYVEYTYRLWCYPMSRILVGLWNKLFHKKYVDIPSPKTLRTDSHKIMHINEPTYSRLKKLFKSGRFRPKLITKVTIEKPVLSWKDRLYNFLVCLIPLSNYYPLNIFFANDFIILADKI